MNHSHPKRLALLLAVLLLLLCLISCLSLYIRSQDTSGSYVAYIYQNGILSETIDLSTVKVEYSFTITSDAGTNRILVQPGGISILEADCPDQVCVHQGVIHNSLLPITCLPHRLVIELHAAKEEASSFTPDAITH